MARRPLAVLLTLHDEESALRVLDHDVGKWDWAGGSSLVELETPARTDSDEGREEGEEENGEKSHAVLRYDRGDQDSDGHGAAEEGEESERAPCFRFYWAAAVFRDPLAADGIVWEAAAVVEGMGYILDIVSDATRLNTKDFARGGVETFGSCCSYQSLWGRHQSWKQKELGQSGDLGVCEH